jgi:hypothetical protein
LAVTALQLVSRQLTKPVLDGGLHVPGLAGLISPMREAGRW